MEIRSTRATLRAAPAGQVPEIPEGAPFVVGEELGSGGMGAVLSARQVRLGREVAVKRAHTASPTMTAALRQEAWVMGRLEHPNVVPVYDFARDEAGEPLLAMKRIGGRAWSDLLGADAALPEEARDDPLAWHLGVLLQVANALSYAHAQGILHRDLKPDNVMVGAFGEVYVLDWGVATAFAPTGDGWLPQAALQERLVGSPAYMAPEMFVPDPTRLGPHTDAYLFGGLLFELLAGEPPHEGESLETCRREAEAPADIDPDWPSDLAGLVEELLDPDPAVRPGLDEVRARIRRHLAGREVRRLLDSVDGQIAELEVRLAAGAEVAELHDRFGACRFGLERVLDRLPEESRALRLEHRLYDQLVRFELDQQRPEAAAVFLRELVDPDPALRRAVEEALASRDAERARLQAIARDAAPSTGSKARFDAVAVLAAVWLGLPLLLALLGWERSYGRMTFQSLVVLVALGMLFQIHGQELRASRFNRLVFTVIACSPSFGLVILLALWLQDAPVTTMITIRAVVDACLLLVAMLALDLTLVPVGVFYLGVSLLTARWPEHATPLLVGGTLVWSTIVLLRWRRALPGSVEV